MTDMFTSETTSRAKPCWKDAGLLEGVSSRRCEATIDRMVAIVAEIGDKETARIALAEAVFRVFELPNRTPEFQAKYKRENGP